jgi:hypothetical protein
MKQVTVLMVIIISGLNAYCQEDTVFIKHAKDWTSDTLVYVTDTVLFSSGMVRHILTGTTVLPETHNQVLCKGYGLYLKKVTKSDCQGSEDWLYKSEEKINSIEITDSTITVDINIKDNCCYDFLCEIVVDENKTLNLIYQGYGSYCACDCDCCFGLTYHIKKVLTDHYPQVTAVMLEGKQETLTEIKKD